MYVSKGPLGISRARWLSIGIGRDNLLIRELQCLDQPAVATLVRCRLATGDHYAPSGQAALGGQRHLWYCARLRVCQGGPCDQNVDDVLRKLGRTTPLGAQTQADGRSFARFGNELSGRKARQRVHCKAFHTFAMQLDARLSIVDANHRAAHRRLVLQSDCDLVTAHDRRIAVVVEPHAARILL